MKRLAWSWVGVLVVALAIASVRPAMAAEVAIESNAQNDNEVFQGTGAAVVFISDTVGYAFYVEELGTEANWGTFKYAKTTDGGATWPTEVQINAQTDIMGFGIWYDRWTPGDTTGTNIYVAFVENGTDRVYFDCIDTGASDAPCGPVIVADLTSFNLNDGTPSITKSTDGDLYIFAALSAVDVWDSIDGGSNWNSTTASFLPNDDQVKGNLMPLSGGDVLLTTSTLQAPIASAVFSQEPVESSPF